MEELEESLPAEAELSDPYGTSKYYDAKMFRGVALGGTVMFGVAAAASIALRNFTDSDFAPIETYGYPIGIGVTLVGAAVADIKRRVFSAYK